MAVGAATEGAATVGVAAVGSATVGVLEDEQEERVWVLAATPQAACLKRLKTF